uniref:Conopeptide n=1 Tax=Conus lenavati TaxID=1519839 RepID=A0A0K8TTS8_CONLV
MWMTISMFAVVVTAATVVGSTVLGERHPWNCCRIATYECARGKCGPNLDPNCVAFCYFIAANNTCGSESEDGCCFPFFDCFMDCVFYASGSYRLCFSICKHAACTAK